MQHKTLVFILSSVLLIQLGSANFSFGRDYFTYHREIIKAEELIFVKKDIPKGLKTYTKVLSGNDFVFLSDCITAIQVAVYQGDTTAFLKLIEIASKNGLTQTHVLKVPYIANSKLYACNAKRVQEIMKANRAIYLSGINKKALAELIEIYGKDQLVKNLMSGESNREYQRRYKQEIRNTYEKFRSIIFRYGFPSEKIVGVDQSYLLRELKIPGTDLVDYYVAYAGSKQTLTKAQFIQDEKTFASTLFFPIIQHYCTMFDYPKLFSDSFYLDQIAKGNIHPKDAAAVVELKFMVMKGFVPNLSGGDKYFGTASRIGSVYEHQPMIIPDSTINRFRESYYLPPIENDRSKWKFMIKEGMTYYFGYRGMRA